jgi:hypothetical protein
VALASRSPLQQLSGNVSPLHSRPGEKAHAVSQPIVVYDVSDGEDEEQEPEAEAAEALPCITQLYDEEEEAPCLVEDEGDAAPGDVPDGYAAGGPCSLSAHNNRRSHQSGVVPSSRSDAAAPDFCDVVAPSDSDFTPVRTALDVLQVRLSRLKWLSRSCWFDAAPPMQCHRAPRSWATMPLICALQTSRGTRSSTQTRPSLRPGAFH